MVARAVFLLGVRLALLQDREEALGERLRARRLRRLDLVRVHRPARGARPRPNLHAPHATRHGRGCHGGAAPQRLQVGLLEVAAARLAAAQPAIAHIKSDRTPKN